jgi:hypothetical protein
MEWETYEIIIYGVIKGKVIFKKRKKIIHACAWCESIVVFASPGSRKIH